MYLYQIHNAKDLPCWVWSCMICCERSNQQFRSELAAEIDYNSHHCKKEDD